MLRAVFLSALLIGAASPALAGPASDAAARDANNASVILSEYPARALAAGEQGAVGFRVNLDREGYASACEVTRSSGYPRLDQETCELILKRATFKGIRDANGRKLSTVHEGVINWRLPDSATPASGAAPTRVAANLPEKKVCRRRLKTGSLADFERLCATRADWERMAEHTRREWGALQGSAGHTHGN